MKGFSVARKPTPQYPGAVYDRAAMTTDVDLLERDVQDLASADDVAAFFARLGWNTNVRRPQQPEHLGLDSEGARRPIRSLEIVASQPDEFYVYLFHLRSVTVAHTGALVPALRQRQGDFLLVPTSDWERIDFVFLDRLLSLRGSIPIGPCDLVRAGAGAASRGGLFAG